MVMIDWEPKQVVDRGGHIIKGGGESERGRNVRGLKRRSHTRSVIFVCAEKANGLAFGCGRRSASLFFFC